MNKIEVRKYYMRILLISILGGVVVNVGLGFITDLFGLPLYLDTIGTIGVASSPTPMQLSSRICKST